MASVTPYRDANNHELKYATNPNAPTITAPLSSPYSPYDSDNEPLIAPTGPTAEELSPDSIQRFTATGRPMPAYKHSNLQALGGDMYTLPQLLPKQYTDDSIIPAIVVDVIPSPKVGEEAKKRKGSGGFLGKLGGKGKKEEGKEGKGITKVVYMPRREYLKFFARGLKGEYTGTERYRRWSEEELEREFGRYRPVVLKRGYRPSA